MAGARQPKLVRKLDDASKVVKAATGLLGQTTHLLRQLVTVVGWLVLLVASMRLLIFPPATLAPANFLGHAAGAAAILQGLVKVPARWRRSPQGIESKVK
ncbi:hypothetical protein [Streptosporangium sp. NPDC020145]|uniref:hypothetical protein n=1 Tax=Streptosporangium sp. NPDC020145 TaxID=3154694 RepID=UPI00341C8AB4